MPGSAETCCDRWTGFSAGVYGAGGAGRVRDAITSSSENRTSFLPPVIISGSNSFRSGELAGDISGGMIDLFAGYNWRAGQFVIGGQAEATIFGDVGMNRAVRWSAPPPRWSRPSRRFPPSTDPNSRSCCGRGRA